MHAIKTFLADQRGATAIEYGLILAMMCIALVAALTSTGGNTAKTFRTVAADMESAQQIEKNKTDAF